MTLIKMMLCLLLLATPYEAEAAPVAAAAEDSFRVLKVAGDTNVFDERRAVWQPLRRGDRVADGALVQVSRDASLRVALQRRVGQKLVITIQKPGIIRLGREMVRRVNNKELMLPFSDGGDSPAVALDQDPSLFQDMSEAWSRLLVVAFGDRPGKAPAASAKLEGMAAGSSAERILLLAPTDNTSIVAESFPTTMPVRWIDVTTGGRTEVAYEIFLWPVGTERGAARASTAGSSFDLPLPGPGQYFLEVSANDGRWRSRPRLVSVYTPARGKQNLEAGGPPDKRHDLRCRAPSQHSVFFVQTLPLAVRVDCRIRRGDDHGYDYVALVERDGQIFSERSDQPHMVLWLNSFGRHLVNVTARRRPGMADGPMVATSKPLTVDIRPTAARGSLDNAFDGGFVYLEDL